MTGFFKILAKFYIQASDDLNAQNIAYQFVAIQFPLACIRWISRDAVALPENVQTISLEGISTDIPQEMFAKRPEGRKPGSAGKYCVGIDFYVESNDRHIAWHLAQRFLDKNYNGCKVFGVSESPAHNHRQGVLLDGISTDNIPPIPKREDNEKKDEKETKDKNLLFALGKEDEFGGREIDY